MQWFFLFYYEKLETWETEDVRREQIGFLLVPTETQMIFGESP